MAIPRAIKQFSGPEVLHFARRLGTLPTPNPAKREPDAFLVHKIALKVLTRSTSPAPSGERTPIYRSQACLAFLYLCACMSIFAACVSNLTKASLSMFNPHSCDLTGRSRIGDGRSGACWSATGATTARIGAGRAWSAPPGGTSPTSGSATYGPAGSGNPASVRWLPSAARWACRWRRGSKRIPTDPALDRAVLVREGGV